MGDRETFGQTGYEAYAKSTGGKTFDGRMMPQWSDLPVNIKNAWHDAADAIAARAVPPNGVESGGVK